MYIKSNIIFQISYPIDQVVIPDSNDMQFVYIVLSGICHVVRAIDLKKQRENRRNKAKNNNQHRKQVQSENNTPTRRARSASNAYYVDSDKNAFFKVDELYRSCCYGLHHFLKEDDERADNRKFVLVSGGCRLLRLPHALLRNTFGGTLSSSIRPFVVRYPSDEQLLRVFGSFNLWRSFREDALKKCADIRSKQFLKKEEGDLYGLNSS